MAAATGVLKRIQSFEFLPPSMSELRVVLLGNSWSKRSSVGNLLLGETVFNTEGESDKSLKARGRIGEKDVVLINTPDLLSPYISEAKQTEHVTDCVRLSDPGPHVFLLVLQPEDFSEEQKLRLCRVLTRFSDQSFEHSLILISPPREASSSSLERLPSDQLLRDMIRECKYRHLQQEQTDRPELLTRLVQTANENSGQLICCKELEGEDTVIIKPKSVFEHKKPALNLVLCGRRGAGKTSAAEAILGQTGLHSASSSSESVKHQGEVCGRWVSLVELPALCGKSLETVMKNSLSCVSLCDPQGVHAFILVLPVDPLTDEDKIELKIIQETFSSQVNDFTMILFSVESDPTDPAVINFLKKNNAIQELIQSCGGRSFVLNIQDQKQIPELMDMVEKMKMERSRCFTQDLFTKAQMEMVVRLRAELQDVNQGSKRGDPDDTQSTECLGVELIEKTGCEKEKEKATDRHEDMDKIIQMQVQKIIQDKEEEIERKEEELRRKHEEDSKTLKKTINDVRLELECEKKKKVKQLQEKDECINKEREQRKKEKDEEERKRKKHEENQRQEWRKKVEASESIVRSEKQLRENADRNLERCRREMRKDREAWEKEIKNLWERIQQENKQNLEEEKTMHRNLQIEYSSKRKKWTYWIFVLCLSLSLLLSYLFLTHANTPATLGSN